MVPMKTRILPWLAAAAALALPAAGHAARPLTVYAAGDIADCRYNRAADSGAAGTAAIIARGDPEALILTLGDHTYPKGAPAEFSDCYAPTWGQFKARTRPTPGNHATISRRGPVRSGAAIVRSRAGPRRIRNGAR